MGESKKTKTNTLNNKNEVKGDNTLLVNGIYNENRKLREKAMARVWGKYSMLPDALTNSLGGLFSISESLSNKLFGFEFNNKSLYDYTHDNTTLYSNSIREKYTTINGGAGNTKAELLDIPKEQYIAWSNTDYNGQSYYEFRENEKKYENTNKKYYFSRKNVDSNLSNYIVDSQTLSSELTKGEIIEKISNHKKPNRKNYDNKDEYKKALDAWKNDKQFHKTQINDLTDTLESASYGPTSLIGKTSQLFVDKKIKSLIDNFCGEDGSDSIDSAKNSQYGNSRGRALLKKQEERDTEENGYDNPFCRAWTFHHQYGQDEKTLIRYSGYTGNKNPSYTEYSVLNNGFVRITPESNNNYNTKSCMFSIENLAWKDVNIENELSRDQQGPNGGRIMWFPPYNLKFQENVNVDWNPISFIGRGEKIYTYTNTDRMGTLSFTMLIDYPSLMNTYFNESSDEKEEEILRFFAGCDMPTKVKTATKGENREPSEPTNENKQGVSDEYADSLKFSVYFPYNYSGKDDTNFEEKLLFGVNNLDISKNSDELDYFQGYEMLPNKGITNTEKDSLVCNGREYYYPIDKDACEYFLFAGKYRDDNSYQLNSTKNLGKNCSFGDIYYLFNHNNNKWENRGYLEHFIDCGLLDLTDERNIISTNNKINKIIKEGGITECSVEIKGVVDEVTHTGITNERIDKIKKFLKDNLSGMSSATTTTYEDYMSNDIHSRENKKKRRVDVEIKFNFPKKEGDETENSNVSADTQEVAIQTTTTSYKQFNEADYFKQLKEKENFLYEKIIEKVKYFEPAFHSLSPEGFNGRLNFLHQCTRQGHTIERKSGDTANTISTAWNLAFGRPPVCVLRIGDFINTKILIQSMNITYENSGGIQWDLNPEGVGVQPMFANISLGIILIGGQSIDAPIQRLNNAVSFNYYANTSLYDDRSDFSTYTGNTSSAGVQDSYIYTPSLVEIQNQQTQIVK